MNSLTKLYDKLSADERARLFVAAAARRDVQELDRLNDTCPRKSYTMEDRDYSRRKINLWILTSTTMATWAVWNSSQWRALPCS
jgi:hypothetical protein